MAVSSKQFNDINRRLLVEAGDAKTERQSRFGLPLRLLYRLPPAAYGLLLFIASMRICATSGRENSRGGISP